MKTAFLWVRNLFWLWMADDDLLMDINCYMVRVLVSEVSVSRGPHGGPLVRCMLGEHSLEAGDGKECCCFILASLFALHSVCSVLIVNNPWKKWNPLKLVTTCESFQKMSYDWRDQEFLVAARSKKDYRWSQAAQSETVTLTVSGTINVGNFSIAHINCFLQNFWLMPPTASSTVWFSGGVS